MDITLLTQAVSFAARAHKNQTRKDGITPYFAHPVRVAFTLSLVFGVTDISTLTAAVLHDAIEDTTTDFDDIAGEFGEDVARVVAALTKDSRLPEARREDAYIKQVVAGGDTVMVCKLADVYDNLTDSVTSSPAQQMKTVAKATSYLAAIESHTTHKQACDAVWAKIREISGV